MEQRFTLPEGARGELIRRMVGRWVIKEDPAKVIARILIPRKDISKSGFESGLMWLLSNRYKVEQYEKADYRILKRLDPGREDKTPFPLDHGLNGDELPLGRHLSITYYEQAVLFHIRGRLPGQGHNGVLADLAFNHKQVPGRANPDGSMNWYELNKFVVVEEDEELCTLLDPVAGRNGLDIFNRPIPPRETDHYDLEIGEGIRETEFIDPKTRRSGKKLVSRFKGVLKFDRDPRGNLRKLDVEDRIKTRCICFKTGNLGDREVKIPVPVFLEEFRPDFRLYSTAFVKCDEVCGGFLTTEDEAELSIVNSGSHVRAGKKITAHIVQSSTLEAPEVHITKNIIDVHIKAEKFVAQDMGRSVVVNTEIDAAMAQLNGVLVQGDGNVIELGKSFLQTQQAATTQIQATTANMVQYEDEKQALLEEIKTNLKEVILKVDPDKKNALIQFAKIMHTYAEPKLSETLDRFRGYGNLKKIETLKQRLIRLAALKTAIAQEKEAKESAREQFREIRDQLETVQFMVSGLVSPGGSLKVRFGQWEKIWSGDGKNHLVLDVAGKVGHNGMIHLFKSKTKILPRSLTYPAVKVKDAQTLGW